MTRYSDWDLGDVETFDAPDTTCHSASPTAIQVSGPDLPRGRHWVPQSVVSDDSEVFKYGDNGTLIIALWFAEKQGWI